MKAFEQIGQLLMIGLSGFSLTTEEKRFLRKYVPAGVIYFRRNVSTPKQLQRLSASVQKELKQSLIGIDQEGGIVARLGEPFTRFPGNDFLGKYYSRTGKVDLIQQQAVAMAKELRSIGVNLNFTPVADVRSNPANPIIGVRSFGDNPRKVAKLVVETIKAYQNEGVICCAKHFPGHGDTFSDSHKVLPVVRASKRTLEKRELVPFRAAIRAKVPTLMSAHVIYTALDPKGPATLSPRIMQDLLRKKLKYRGVLISDDLEMNAIAKHQSIGEAAVEAIRVGVDLLLVCKSLDIAEEVIQAIQGALRVGTLSEKRVQEALRRVQSLKKGYAIGRRDKSFSRIPEEGWLRHRGYAEKIAQEGH